MVNFKLFSILSLALGVLSFPLLVLGALYFTGSFEGLLVLVYVSLLMAVASIVLGILCLRNKNELEAMHKIFSWIGIVLGGIMVVVVIIYPLIVSQQSLPVK